MELQDNIKKIASEIKDEVIAIRRALHKNPELSFKEYDTSAFIKATLDEIGVPWVPIADTGVLATIGSSRHGKKVIALRADIDALPIQEKTGLAFQSANPGIMHACGHDIHTASLLGVARILQQVESDLKGTVKLIFQPGEEILPGGATKIIEEEALTSPRVDLILGQHVMPSLESGKVALRKGKMMASMDEIRITVKGKGGHGALPHENRDPVIAASTMIVALQQVVSRHIDPRIPSVLSFGKVIANGAINIIPDSVSVEGTFRTFDDSWREKAHDAIRDIASTTVAGLGCTCEVDIRKGYPTLHNNEKLTDAIHSYAQEYVGPHNVLETDIWMASDDFAYYTQHVAGCYYMLGAGFSDKSSGSLHTSTLEINEESLELGMGLMAYLAIRSLEE